jgi:hypothetical protein
VSEGENVVPAEVIFRRLMPSKFPLTFQAKFFGAADSILTGNAELETNLLLLRDDINRVLSDNVKSIIPAPGMTLIHLEYLKSSEKAAMAFYGDDVAFIAITDKLMIHICDNVEALMREPRLFDLFGVEMTPAKQETLGSALLTIQTQVASSHELGHILHGHCEETALFTPRIDSSNYEQSGSGGLRAQAMEVEADGYVPHMLLKNLFEGGVSQVLNEKLAPSISIDDFTMKLLTMSACSLFYLWGPRTFDAAKIYDEEHPPVLARLNVMLTDQNGWCSQYAPRLVGWATTAKFREIMDVLTTIAPGLRGAWDAQSAFLETVEGISYYESIYTRREELRAEMASRQWIV